jgi:MoaA/NifB/PqqE/SkfB family radical SAM enzyme
MAEIHADGAVFVCCPRYSDGKTIGNIFRSSPNEVWNSATAVAFREGVLDGSFKMCHPVQCPFIAGKSLPLKTSLHDSDLVGVVRNKITRTLRGPRHVKLAHDDSCNLSCPSCRDHLIVAKKEKQRELDRVLNEFILPFLADADTVELAGDGDPFASKHYRDILALTAARYPKMQISLHTNAVLCDEQNWNELKLEGRVRSVLVSIDASTKETYDYVRRNGNWERLNENLKMLAEKRRAGSVKWLTLAFVVQSRNYTEMADFVRLAKRYNADRVSFSLIYKWDRAMSDEAFLNEQIWLPEHPKFAEFRATLADPIFRDPTVSLGDVARFL